MRFVAALGAVAIAAFTIPLVVRAEEAPSIKEGFKELGRGIAADSKKGWDATKEVSKEGWDATKRGTGTALQKTGEGLDKAGNAVVGAGSDVKGDPPAHGHSEAAPLEK
jgi:hypothetical protein